ncbi:MAG TPA: hypothetical protein VFC71_09810 [Candidatus Polarisedimenticolia bacterium]|nr:hypothetical protein [Candidatus Polarisedimenticolia bacterium]
MYLLHAAIVADRLAAFHREADDSRLAALGRETEADEPFRPSFPRRLIARTALGISQATARVASWSDPTSSPSAEALGYR